jgi:hypothetical protein
LQSGQFNGVNQDSSDPQKLLLSGSDPTQEGTVRIHNSVNKVYLGRASAELAEHTPRTQRPVVSFIKIKSKLEYLSKFIRKRSKIFARQKSKLMINYSLVGVPVVSIIECVALVQIYDVNLKEKSHSIN